MRARTFGYSTHAEPVEISDCAEVQGLSVPSNSENIHGVNVVDEATLCGAPRSLHSGHFLHPVAELQDLKSFLGRPILVARGSLPTAPGLMYSLTMSWTSLLGEIPFLAERLRGVRGFRADAVFSVEHNANPFHQGLYAASFQYGAGQFNRGSRASMCTNLPHVRLNLADHTRVELRVPALS